MLFFSPVLSVQFEQSVYSMLEDMDQMICLVLAQPQELLDASVTVSVSLITSPGPSDGK